MIQNFYCQNHVWRENDKSLYKTKSNSPMTLAMCAVWSVVWILSCNTHLWFNLTLWLCSHLLLMEISGKCTHNVAHVRLLTTFIGPVSRKPSRTLTTAQCVSKTTNLMTSSGFCRVGKISGKHNSSMKLWILILLKTMHGALLV